MRQVNRSLGRLLGAFLGIALLATGLVPAPAHAADDYRYWVSHPQTKIYTSTSVPSTHGSSVSPSIRMSLAAARAEHEGRQLVLHADAFGLRDVWIAPSELTLRDAGGAIVDTIPASNVSTFKVHYVYIAKPSLGYSRVGWEPDPLLPMTLANGARISAGIRSVPRGQTQPFYVSFEVPADATPGTYTGTLAVTGLRDTGAALPPLEVPVTLTVYPLSVAKQSLKTSFGWSLRWAAYAGSAQHTLLPQGSGPNRVTETTDFYADQINGWLEYLAEHRVSPMTMTPAWEGGSDALPPNDAFQMIARDAYLRDYLGTGTATTHDGERYGFTTVMLPEQVIPSYTRNPFASTTDKSRAATYYRTARNELAAAGYLGKSYIFAIDEPAGTQRSFIENYGAFVHQYAPGVKFMVTTEPNRWDFKPLRNVDTYVHQLQFYYRDYAKWVAPLRRSGKEVWIYSTSSSFQKDIPLYLIDKPLPESRAIGWFAYDTDAQGLLYWSVNRWGSTSYRDPYKDPLSFLNSNGDGSLVYPGYYPSLGLTVEGAPPVGSLRMEALRDGLEDYEYLKLLEKAAGAAVADYYAKRIVGKPTGVVMAGSPTFPSYPKDPGSYEKARAMIVHRLTATTTYDELAGSNRYDTAVRVSRRGFESAPTVVIATGENWPDALGGASLAAAEGGPMLLTMPGSLPGSVLTEIRRLGAGKAIILGGTSAVGPAVESALKRELGPANVRRLAGSNRIATAELIARATVARLGGAYDGTVFVATAGNFPDALAASPLAAARGWPILLAQPGGLTGSTRETMNAIGAEKALVLGGTAVVSASTEAWLRSALGTADVKRLAGSTRYATAAAVAGYGVSSAGLAYDDFALATGENFPDALAGGVLQGRRGSIMLLTTPGALQGSVSALLAAHKAEIDSARFLGGSGALGIAPREQVRQILD